MENPINPLDPQHAYLIGFLYGDGHLELDSRNPAKGKVTVELSVRDKDLLYAFQRLFPDSSVSFRHRSTNFSDDCDSAVWRICGQSFRHGLLDLGMPAGRKSLTVAPLTMPHSIIDFWRGLIDADGSLGITARGIPFLSLVTTSEAMARAYEAFLTTITGSVKVTNRNKRDSAFNVGVLNEDAVKVAAILYYDGCLGLERKIAKAKEVRAWVRPAHMRKVIGAKPWTLEDDALVMELPYSKCASTLHRSVSSIRNRRFRLSRARRQISA